MKRQTEWKNRLLTLPDTAFFNMMRNYLGSLETPFNKHKMIEKLHRYLMKESTQRLMAAGLDELDKKILTIIFLLDGSPEGYIIDLLQERWSSWEIRQRILNLQERLLLFKGHRELYFPAPQPKAYLKREAITPGELFRTTPREEGRNPVPWLNDSFLTAFLSFMVHCSPVRKADGSLSRRSLNEIKNTFPCFRDVDEKADFFFRVMTRGGFLTEEPDNRYKTVPSEWSRLAESKPYTRCLSLWAEFLTYPEDLTFPWKPEDGEKVISGLIKSMPLDLLYDEAGMIRIIGLLLAEKRPPRGDMETVLRRLKYLGILIAEKEGIGLCREINEGASRQTPGGRHTLLPSHEITLMPGEDFKKTLPLAWYTRIISYDQAATYLLAQESYFRGLHRGKELPPFEQVIKDLSDSEIPQNISFSLKNWEEQFRAVRLLEGIILKVDAPRIPFIEKNPLFTPYIREILAPGVYLMDPAEKNLWENSLLNTGITAIPPVERLHVPEPQPKTVHRRVEEGIRLVLAAPQLEAPASAGPPSSKEKLVGEKELLAALEGLKLTEEEKDELEARIRKKVILQPSQLKGGIVQKEIREAKGLDYNGKIRLIESAVSSGQEYLEISWFTPDDDLRTDKIIPRHLSKENNDLILSGPYLTDPGGTPFRIRVRKISHCKRKKISFFGL